MILRFFFYFTVTLLYCAAAQAIPTARIVDEVLAAESSTSAETYEGPRRKPGRPKISKPTEIGKIKETADYVYNTRSQNKYKKS